MKYNDIKVFPNIHYHCDVPMSFIPEKIAKWEREQGLQLNPDFQRGHVWTTRQQIAYIEYLMRDPVSGKEIYFNHPGAI